MAAVAILRLQAAREQMVKFYRRPASGKGS